MLFIEHFSKIIVVEIKIAQIFLQIWFTQCIFRKPNHSGNDIGVPTYPAVKN